MSLAAASDAASTDAAATEPTAELLIRPALASELPFIFSSWMKSYEFGSKFAKSVSHAVFAEFHSLVIERLLARESAAVAYAANEPWTIIGWRCATGPVLHYVYVKGMFRRMGVARALLGSYGAVTHRTKMGEFILSKHPEWVYNPYLI